MSMMAQVDRARSQLQEANGLLSKARGSCMPGDIPLTCGPFAPEMPDIVRDTIRALVVISEGTSKLLTGWANNTGEPLAWGDEDFIAAEAEARLLFNQDPNDERLQSLAARNSPYLADYKDRWVRHYAQEINRAAAKYNLPPELLAGVTWEEAGGQPDSWDRRVYNFRNSWFGKLTSGLDDAPLGPLGRLFGPSEATSFGTVQMQVGVAAEELGYISENLGEQQKEEALRNLSEQQRKDIIAKLQDPATNIELAARHLASLREGDGYDTSSEHMSDEEFVTVATQYNQGDRCPTDIQDRSYGQRILDLRENTNSLLEE